MAALGSSPGVVAGAGATSLPAAPSPSAAPAATGAAATGGAPGNSGAVAVAAAAGSSGAGAGAGAGSPSHEAQAPQVLRQRPCAVSSASTPHMPLDCWPAHVGSAQLDGGSTSTHVSEQGGSTAAAAAAAAFITDATDATAADDLGRRALQRVMLESIAILQMQAHDSKRRNLRV